MTSQKSLRVLLVEDDEASRQQTETRLSLLGYQVFPCASGQSAIEACARGVGYDLVLMDLRHGEAETVAHVRQENNTRNVPILVVAADPEAGPTPGADHVIGRPYHLHELVRAIGETFERRRTR